MQTMGERVDTVIVGAGQAGLAMSCTLTQAGHRHVVLERGRIGQAWRDRWDSFTLLSPNWHTRLPSYSYRGDDIDGFMTRDEVVAFFEGYARSFEAPVREGVNVEAIAPGSTARFVVRTNAGVLDADQIVIAIGHYHVPAIPACSEHVPARVVQVHSSRYRSPQALPPGSVLVVGAGASGQQIVEDLVKAGRTVYLSVGRHNKLPRRYRGRDIVWWMDQMGMFDQTAASLPSLEEAMRKPSVSLTGVGGGHDLDLHALARDGVTLLGHLRSIDGNVASFAEDLNDVLAAGDQVFVGFTKSVDDLVTKRGIDAPVDRDVRVEPRRYDAPGTLDLSEVAAIVWATGFKNDLGWIEFPILSPRGEPIQTRGVTAQPGLYFLGLRWLFKRKSNFIDGVGEDVAFIAEQILAPS